jgi:hypothetical protein
MKTYLDIEDAIYILATRRTECNIKEFRLYGPFKTTVDRIGNRIDVDGRHFAEKRAGWYVLDEQIPWDELSVMAAARPDGPVIAKSKAKK